MLEGLIKTSRKALNFASDGKVKVKVEVIKWGNNDRGDFGWNDIGGWSAIYGIPNKDSLGNALRGDIIAIAAERVFAYSTKKLAAIVGLKDIIVVETDDALLVCSKDKAQDVKRVVDLLEQQKKNEYL